MSEAKQPDPKFKTEPQKAIDKDLTDPVLTNPIELTVEQIVRLEKNVTICFLCRWILEDYKAHGTLKGHKSGDGFEIFPVRGEIDHLSLELNGKPYPWKEPINEYESKPHGFTKSEKLVPVEPVVAATPRPDPSKKDAHGPAITIKADPNAVPLSKPKQKPNNIRL